MPALFRRWGTYLWGSLGLLFASLVIHTEDGALKGALVNTDYENAFYVAGHMVRSGLAEGLYPGPAATSFKQAFFDTYAHGLLKTLPESHVSLFMYPPAAACIFSPLSLLAPDKSLMVWQIICVASLMIAALIFCRAPRTSGPSMKIALASFLLIPVTQVLMVGQTTLALGLLPLTAGYVMWQLGRPLRAGVCWSMLWLKPQALVPALMIAAAAVLASALTKPGAGERKDATGLIIGLVAGSLVLHGAAIITTGTFPLAAWLSSMAMVNTTFADTTHFTWAPQLMTSLSGTVLSLMPHEWRMQAVGTVNVLAAAAATLCLWLMVRTQASTMAQDARKDALVLLSVSFLPLTLPYLRLYDLALLLLPGWIAYFRLSPESPLGAAARDSARAIWIAVNVYSLTVVMPCATLTPIWLAALLAVMVESCRRFACEVHMLAGPPSSEPEAIT